MLNNLDVILIAAAAILIVVSFTINIISSSRLTKLTETLGQLETKFETLHPKKDENDTRHGSSSVKFDSSILPSQEYSPADSRIGTRYRPPGSRAKRPEDSGSEDGEVKVPSTRQLKIGKGGMKITDETPTDSEAVHLAEPQSDKAPSTSSPPPTDDEAKALLKAYLGREMDYAVPATEEGDGDVMEVVEDTGVFERPLKSDADHKSS